MYNDLPAELRKLLRWKLSNITPAVVKKVVTNSGFRLMRKTCSEWGGTWGKHMKAELFKELHECQKINHLPGMYKLFPVLFYIKPKSYTRVLRVQMKDQF